MSGNTGIEWTDRTWNPLTGCTKVSPGCDHCYAKTMHERFHGAGSFDAITLHPSRLDQPLRWQKPARVFVNSMSDLFHQDVSDEYIGVVFAYMLLAPQHTFQVLTKRHARMRSLLSSETFRLDVQDIAYAIKYPDTDSELNPRASDQNLRLWPLPNVWLGVSVENQQWADIRIPALLDTPAAVRFLSCEPLLGPVDLSGPLSWNPYQLANEIDWVIVGGESGRGSRPMHPEWARSLRDQCVAAEIPFLFKQWGEFGQVSNADNQRDQVMRLGKKAAGRVLDGRTWDEYPNQAAS